MRSSTRTRPYKLLHNIQPAGCSPVSLHAASQRNRAARAGANSCGRLLACASASCAPRGCRTVAQCVRHTDARMRAAAERGEKCGDRLQASVLRVPQPCCAGRSMCALQQLWRRSPAQCAELLIPFWRRLPAPAAQRGSVTAHLRCRRSMLCCRQRTRRFGLRCCRGVAACGSPP